MKIHVKTGNGSKHKMQNNKLYYFNVLKQLDLGLEKDFIGFTLNAINQRKNMTGWTSSKLRIYSLKTEKCCVDHIFYTKNTFYLKDTNASVQR